MSTAEPVSHAPTVFRGLSVVMNTRGADKNSLRKEIVEGLIFDGMVSFRDS